MAKNRRSNYCPVDQHELYDHSLPELFDARRMSSTEAMAAWALVVDEANKAKERFGELMNQQLGGVRNALRALARVFKALRRK